MPEFLFLSGTFYWGRVSQATDFSWVISKNLNMKKWVAWDILRKSN